MEPLCLKKDERVLMRPESRRKMKLKTSKDSAKLKMKLPRRD
jgi:hypothetical protein